MKMNMATDLQQKNWVAGRGREGLTKATGATVDEWMDAARDFFLRKYL